MRTAIQVPGGVPGRQRDLRRRQRRPRPSGGLLELRQARRRSRRARRRDRVPREDSDDRYSAGTSMAAPLVAATTAMLRKQKAVPVAKIRELLLKTVDHKS